MSEPKPVKEDPRFISTTGKPELLALLSGHTVSVTNEDEGTPLPARFHKIAIAAGVVPLALKESFLASQEAESATGGNTQDTREQVIDKAIMAMVQTVADDPTKQAELFTNDGRPDARAISTRCGFPVNAVDRDEAWLRISNDSEE